MIFYRVKLKCQNFKGDNKSSPRIDRYFDSEMSKPVAISDTIVGGVSEEELWVLNGMEDLLECNEKYPPVVTQVAKDSNILNVLTQEKKDAINRGIEVRQCEEAVVHHLLDALCAMRDICDTVKPGDEVHLDIKILHQSIAHLVRMNQKAVNYVMTMELAWKRRFSELDQILAEVDSVDHEAPTPTD